MVSIYVYVYIHVSIHKHICTYMSGCRHACAPAHVWVGLHEYMCYMHMGMFLHVLVWMGVPLSMCICVHVQVGMHGSMCERFVPLSICTCVDLCVSGHEHLCVHVSGCAHQHVSQEDTRSRCPCWTRALVQVKAAERPLLSPTATQEGHCRPSSGWKQDGVCVWSDNSYR